MTLDLVAGGSRRADHPHDGVTDTWKAAIGTSCREELVVELAEKSIDADSPSGALWSGKLTSADARVRHTSSTELVSESPDSRPRIERADGETTGSRRFTEPAPANLQIDVRKGVYDFDITGAFQLALTARTRTEIREADGSVNRSAGSGEVPALVGKSISPALVVCQGGVDSSPEPRTKM